MQFVAAFSRCSWGGTLGISASLLSHTTEAPKILRPVGDATEIVDTLYPFIRVVEEGLIN